MFAAKLREHAVFSAHAEVVPRRTTGASPRSSILRARGGSSGTIGQLVNDWEYSPRTRR